MICSEEFWVLGSMVGSVLRLDQVLIPEDAPIRFGTDGWRGIIGAEFTFNRLLRAAKAAAAVSHRPYPHRCPQDYFPWVRACQR